MKHLLFTLLLFPVLGFAQVPDSLETQVVRDELIEVAHDTVHVQGDPNLAKTPYDILEASDSLTIVYSGTLAGTFSAGASERLLVNTQHAVMFQAGRLSLPLSASYNLGYTNGQQKEGELYYITSPSYDVRHWRIYNDVEYESSRLLGIDSRFLLGGGIGYRILGKQGNNLTISNLVLRETTLYDDNILKQLVRSSTRLKFTLSTGIFTWASSSFFQPALNSEDYRASTNNSVSIRVNKLFSVTFASNYRYESVVQVGRNNGNLLTTVGATLNLH